MNTAPRSQPRLTKAGFGRMLTVTLTLAVGVTTLLVPPVSRAAAPSKPNILFILTDDQNPDTLGCFGGKVLTPTLDRLCAEGVKFTRAYNSSSVCTPLLATMRPAAPSPRLAL